MGEFSVSEIEDSGILNSLENYGNPGSGIP
jgi:hypothetical protein